MKNLIGLCVLCTLFSCQKIAQDTLPLAVNVIDPNADFSHIVYYTAGNASLINVNSVFNEVDAASLLIKQAPSQGSVRAFDENYLLYQPQEGITDLKREVMLLADPLFPEQVETIALLPLPAPPPKLECVAVEGQPTYLGMPLRFTMKQGEELEVELLELFCDRRYTGSAGVNVIEYEDYGSGFLQIHISTRSFRFEAKPPKNYVGTQAVIYELCYGLPPHNGDDWIENLDQCTFFLYTPIIVEVME